MRENEMFVPRKAGGRGGRGNADAERHERGGTAEDAGVLDGVAFGRRLSENAGEGPAA